MTLLSRATSSGCQLVIGRPSSTVGGWRLRISGWGVNRRGFGIIRQDLAVNRQQLANDRRLRAGAFLPNKKKASAEPTSGVLRVTEADLGLNDLWAGMHEKGRDRRGGPRGGQTGGWRRLPKWLGAVVVGYKCH